MAEQRLLPLQSNSAFPTRIDKGCVVRLLFFYGFLLVFGGMAGTGVLQWVDLELSRAADSTSLILLTIFVLFVVTAAVPFVPGAEIGVMLMILFGKPVVIPVYLGMIAALIFSFLAGRLIPKTTLHRWFAAVGQHRIAEAVTRLSDRRCQMPRGTDRTICNTITRNRYFILCAMLNIPGNSAIGGGGGIAFAAGACELFTLRGFVLSVALAVCPVPLIFLFALG